MKKYLVKTTSVATNENTNFKGQESIAYFGIGGRMLGQYGSHAEHLHTITELNDYMIKEYGYSRESDAKRNWSYKNPENTKFWRTTVEIVEFDV